MNQNVVLIGSKLVIDGFLFRRSKNVPHKGKTYWDCARLIKKECTARAITSLAENDVAPEIFKHPPHDHPADPDDCQAEITKYRLKQEGEQHPDRPPSRIVQSELINLTQRVVARLPERENLKRTIRKARRRILPPNPKTLSDLQNIPDSFKSTLTGDRFLMYDSNDDGMDGRILVFSTRRNLQLLSDSHTWFLDGTFKVSPVLFTQLFTVLGVVKKNTVFAALPMVYALLTSKETIQYSTVLRAITSAADELHIEECSPRRIMTDFERGIISASQEIFPDSEISSCFFHLGQSVYRKIQENGLQSSYQSPEDDTVRSQIHMLLALAFVPIEDVPSVFRKLRQTATECLLPTFEYFEATYIGIPARGRRPAKAAMYSPKLWNQREAAITGDHKTNNVSEGWHHRFRLMVGKNHPDIFSLLSEIQKEQADTDIAVTELCLGRRVRAAPKKKWIDYQSKLQNITMQYDQYKRDNKELKYLDLIGCNIVL